MKTPPWRYYEFCGHEPPDLSVRLDVSSDSPQWAFDW